MKYPVTPDGRYFIVRGRLWRCSNPKLSDDRRAELVAALMSARRSKQKAIRAADDATREIARLQEDAAKVALGEQATGLVGRWLPRLQ
jgi:ATP-dependent exoDNAse (exonuclease V) alpha subunit